MFDFKVQPYNFLKILRNIHSKTCLEKKKKSLEELNENH